jgi:two-component system, response regulator PdtaR
MGNGPQLSQRDSATPPARPGSRLRLVRSREDGVGAGEAEALPPRVLIVEDNYLISAEMELALSDAGCSVVGVAATADEAVRLALAAVPDLVVMDIRLQDGGDGVEVALKIFADRGIRSLFASAYHDPDTRQRAAPAAPLGWLSKPYTVSALVEAVRAAVRELRES